MEASRPLLQAWEIRDRANPSHDELPISSAGCAGIRLSCGRTGNVRIRYPPVTLMWRLTLGRL